jgi:protein gp37
MADKSDIGWTGATWNVITGCAIKSPACRLCYAMDLAGTRLKNHPSRSGLTKQVNGRHVWTGEVRFNEDWLRQPLQWKRPREIFVVAHGDLFYEEVPDAWIYRVFAVMALAQRHTFQLLTKRSDRMRQIITHMGKSIEPLEREARALGYTLKFDGAGMVSWPLPNVHAGVSAERQREADERIPDLLATPAAKRYVSAEPLLEDIEFEGRGWLKTPENPGGLDQIIDGGESGKGEKRNPVPTHIESFRNIRRQCRGTGTAYFHKQNGSWLHESQMTSGVRSAMYLDGTEQHHWPDGSVSFRVGTGAAGALLDGVAHEGRPS